MSKHPPLLACLAALAALAAGPALAAPHVEKNDTYKNPAIKAGGNLDLTNLVGHVSVVAATDGVLAVDSKVVAAAGSDADAQALAGKIHIETQVSGNNVQMFAHYPLDESTDYYYHREGNLVIGSSRSSTMYEGERVVITDGTFGTGLNLHVDFVVHVPKGVHVSVDNKVGMIEATGVDAPLTLKSGSGDIKADKGSDRLEADTGSGDITVSDQAGAVDLESGSGDLLLSRQKGGDVKVKTGSGDVKLTDVAGKITGDTGSGDISLEKFSGNGANLETGSGEISIRDASGSMKLSTGSGDITATGLKAGEVLETDTGSGSTNISGDLGDLVRLSANAGSGDIVIHTSRVPSLHISATSDSGDLNIDLPGMQNVSVRHHSFSGDVNGGKGSAELEAGSGDVTFTKG